MSAYMVDMEHVLYLADAAAALSFDMHRSPFRWYHSDPARCGSIRLGAEDAERAAVASMLWAENERSVDARYPSHARKPDEPSAYVVSPEQAGRVRWWGKFDPVQVLKSCACLRYQSCETDDWDATQAASFIQSLEALAIASLPGWESAEWGAPRPAAVVS